MLIIVVPHSSPFPYHPCSRQILTHLHLISNAFLAKNSDANIIFLGIGDTTRAIPPIILAGLQRGVSLLGDESTYTGYGDGNDREDLCEKIAEVLYGSRISPNDVFVSDGAKCDIARL